MKRKRTFGQAIRQKREKVFGTTQVNLAKYLSYSQAQLSRLENGYPLKNIENKKYIAKKLGIYLGTLR